MAQYGSHVHSIRIYTLHRYYFRYFGHLEEKYRSQQGWSSLTLPIKVSDYSSKGSFYCIYHVEWVRNTSYVCSIHPYIHIMYVCICIHTYILNQVKLDLILSRLVSSIIFVYQHLIAFWMYCVDSSFYTGAAGQLSIAWAIDIRIASRACICVSVHGLRAWDPCQHTILCQSINQTLLKCTSPKGAETAGTKVHCSTNMYVYIK